MFRSWSISKACLDSPSWPVNPESGFASQARYMHGREATSGPLSSIDAAGGILASQHVLGQFHDYVRCCKQASEITMIVIVFMSCVAPASPRSMFVSNPIRCRCGICGFSLYASNATALFGWETAGPSLSSSPKVPQQMWLREIWSGTRDDSVTIQPVRVSE